MDIVIHCGGLPFNGETINKKSLGGSESAAYYMAKGLKEDGHNVTIFTNSQDDGSFDGVTYCFMGQCSEQSPYGDRFHYYAEATPHDVLIVQRNPVGFSHTFAAKVNLLWLHDLALYSQKVQFCENLWNVDGVLTVSQYHKDQVCDVYGLNPDTVYPITNGVDLSLFEANDENKFIKDMDKTNLIYSSRPERGLENLVKEGGIMEMVGNAHHLYVCSYDNVTDQMRPYYEYLWGRCEQLSNVTLLGNLTKRELANVMMKCDAMIYPNNFEEVSCITAMECMASGLPFISSAHAALPETCENSGSVLIPLDGGTVNCKAFADKLMGIHTEGTSFIDGHVNRQLNAAHFYSWDKAVARLEKVIYYIFEKADPVSKCASMLKNSDIMPLRAFIDGPFMPKGIGEGIKKELDICYDFVANNTYEAHYKAYYQYEKDRGVNYGPEKMEGNSRFDYVSEQIRKHLEAKGSGTIIDYGCAHGHYTISLAKLFPDSKFIGVDIEQTNIDKAIDWAKKDNINNVTFIHGEHHNLNDKIDSGAADVIILAEVLEHLPCPDEVVDQMGTYLNDDGITIITTPYGPWEAIGYKAHYPFRAHIWHFEREDLREMYGMHPEFRMAVVPSGQTPTGDPIGSFVCVFGKPKTGSLWPNFERKFKTMSPRQTVSLCMIVKDAEADILRCLKSVEDHVNEVVIGLDRTTSDGTLKIITEWANNLKGSPSVVVENIDSPLETGFDAARNKTIDLASGEWVLWMDSDEVMHHPQAMDKYLRNNQFSGYAIQQHHFTVEPAGLLKTDLPCRLFRNNQGIKFFGVVHEHPEKELNKGVGHVHLIHDLSIAHHGYSTEDVRRGRFSRNIGLMVRDRELYPKRNLGKFLWIRDLAQMCIYDMEHNGNRVSPEMRERAEHGINLWKDLLSDGQTRMCIESLEYYSMLNGFDGEGFHFSFKLGSNKHARADITNTPVIAGYFDSQESINALFSKLVNEGVKDYGSRYF